MATIKICHAVCRPLPTLSLNATSRGRGPDQFTFAFLPLENRSKSRGTGDGRLVLWRDGQELRATTQSRSTAGTAAVIFGYADLHAFLRSRRSNCDRPPHRFFAASIDDRNHHKRNLSPSAARTLIWMWRTYTSCETSTISRFQVRHRHGILATSSFCCLVITVPYPKTPGMAMIMASSPRTRSWGGWCLSAYNRRETTSFSKMNRLELSAPSSFNLKVVDEATSPDTSCKPEDS